MKQNLDIPKMIFPENYLPPYMRFGIIKRVIRFLFVPITMLAYLVTFAYNSDMESINNNWANRADWMAKCQADHFPVLNCSSSSYSLNFRGNVYDTFYLYSKTNTSFYTSWYNLIDSDMTSYTYSAENSNRVWRTQTWFRHWKMSTDSSNGITNDTRPAWNSSNTNDAILCLNPDTTSWEDYVPDNTYWLRGNMLWISIVYIFISIIVTDFAQLVFEGSMLFAIETSLKPTSIERLKDSEKIKDEELNDQGSSEHK